MVNGEVVKKINHNVDETKDKILAYGKHVSYSEYIYLMLNKPAGVITATTDSKDKTVLDFIRHKRKKRSFSSRTSR